MQASSSSAVVGGPARPRATLAMATRRTNAKMSAASETATATNASRLPSG